jgi:predicted unusual protein kinase regulating ubiquinone biosynthesis (AarF/ABC1/UbiB family)
MKEKTFIHKYSELNELVAKEYIEKFMKDVKRWSPEGIDYIREKECIARFNKEFKGNKELDMPKIIQGENEINLAINLYNIFNSGYGWN